MSKGNWEGKEFKGWTVHERLGKGGNGFVRRAARADQQGAIKILKSDLWTGKRYNRFARADSPKEHIEAPNSVLFAFLYTTAHFPQTSETLLFSETVWKRDIRLHLLARRRSQSLLFCKP